MLKKIFLKEHASYGKEGSSLETDKAINLIYGLNGSGKTTITNYLSNQESEDFKDCIIDFFDKSNPSKIYVYNENFIEKNFRKGGGNVKGIFSLSEDSVNNKEKIKTINEERNKLDNIKTTIENEIKYIRDELEKFNNNAQDKLWNTIKSYKNSGLLKKYENSKNKFFYTIIKLKLPDEEPIITCDQIKLEYEQLNNEDLISIDSNSIKEVDFNQYTQIENDAIFSEIIVGNDNSIVANLIKKL
jgi:DNA repair exonuclease SbcCD ATPase subunit